MADLNTLLLAAYALDDEYTITHLANTLDCVIFDNINDLRLCRQPTTLTFAWLT